MDAEKKMIEVYTSKNENDKLVTFVVLNNTEIDNIDYFNAPGVGAILLIKHK